MEPNTSAEQNESSQAANETPENNSSQGDFKPQQSEAERTAAAFDRLDAELSGVEQAPKEPEVTQQPENSGQQALEAPAHWSEADKAAFKAQPREAQEFLINRHREMESGFNKKFQALAEERKRIEPLAFLDERLRKDPDFREHLKSYEARKPEKQAEQPPDDPIELIKWEAKKEFREELQREREAALAQQHEHRVKQTIETVTSDPMFDAVHKGIESYIKAQPKAIQAALFHQLDNDPDAYLETYELVKNVISGNAKPKSSESKQPEVKAPIRKETLHKPLLETSGAIEQPLDSKRFKEIRSKARNGDVKAIGSLFDMADKARA